MIIVSKDYQKKSSISKSWYDIDRKIGVNITWLSKNPSRIWSKRVCKSYQKFNSLFQDQKTKYAEKLIAFADLFGSNDVKLKKRICSGLNSRESLDKEKTEK